MKERYFGRNRTVREYNLVPKRIDIYAIERASQSANSGVAGEIERGAWERLKIVLPCYIGWPNISDES